MTEEISEKIVPVLIEDEMKRSYIDYAMSVIIGRALPDVRDGLKPVHRRILYAMYEQGMTSDKPYKKSARIVGDVLGKYHPHGDTAVYDTIVRMVQDFSLRYPLLDGQGNFGSIDGDSAAAMRYTEVRLAKIADEMLSDIDKETCNFTANYDGSLKEPTIIPAKLPNLMINGSTGIAVGMATNIPPHNLGEIVDGIILLIDKPDATILELMELIKGPDFPTAATILGRAGILNAYTTGRGSIKLRAVAEIEENKQHRRILVTELPYQVNKARLIENIAALVRDKKIIGITDLRDESDKDGMRIVIEISRTANPHVVLNQLYNHTQMQTTFGVINLAIVNGAPKVLNLKEILTHYLAHRKEIITRRSQYDLNKAEQRAHILEGLKIALDNIDRIIKLIRASGTPEIAKRGLIEQFNLTEIQAKAILELRLQKLTALEQDKIDEEHKKLLTAITKLKEILASETKILSIIKQELQELKTKYVSPRRTEIIETDETIEIEDLITKEDVVITITNTGYIKRQPIDAYRQQLRGGRGVTGMGTKEEDFVRGLFIASTHDYILFFTDRGRVHWLKVYEIPDASRQSKGKAIINLVELTPDEKITAAIPISSFDDKHYLIMATRKGIIKKTILNAFKNPRKGGIIAINLDDQDKLITVKLTDGTKQIIIGTSHGKAIHFNEIQVRDVGRSARGVKGIKLIREDIVIGMAVAEENATLLTITENGYGKRTNFSEYRTTNRGGQGIINIISNPRNGKVVDVKTVTETDEIMITTQSGIIIRILVKGIRTQGRNTQGVRIMKVQTNDFVVATARLAQEQDIE
ncbi:MAG: DNA gyrase subunit A [Candidatus Argoarchaeum ethanivorans]|uniref:DNA gyrase subunit A n=1 Tax=Candidatus Argoarchaeum ethanivorans TaxID=2608793 RepID=A0A8B3S6J6_9EURY|nr:MAG: DNA gyrase subunit A [Candidatus Argoarchaeum ethanivorans]